MDSTEVRRRWAERTGAYSPTYYAHYGPDETSAAIHDLLESVVSPDAAVLELGCSSGRHLAHLHEHGYEDLHGIEINADAFCVMAETYPELAAEGTFSVGAIEDTVTEFRDGRFDAVFSVETLQHLHPDDEWVFTALSRITDELLITAENEGNEDDHESDDPAVNYVDSLPLYYRDWNGVFTDRGFVEVEVRSLDRDTLRAFRPARDRQGR